jgi:hypothetical protein
MRKQLLSETKKVVVNARRVHVKNTIKTLDGQLMNTTVAIASNQVSLEIQAALFAERNRNTNIEKEATRERRNSEEVWKLEKFEVGWNWSSYSFFLAKDASIRNHKQVTIVMYRHNPYAPTVTTKLQTTEEELMGGPQPSGLSDSDCESRCTTPGEEGMGARSSSRYFEALSPMLPFFTYGAEVRMLRKDETEQMGLVRLFVGQVPYHLEASHVAWMMGLLSGRRAFLVEKIVRWTQSRKPCGCFHVYCHPDDAEAMLSVDQTVLCEEDGMWVARDAVEQSVLMDHCAILKENKDARAPLMPYQLMTVQRATSSYQRPMRELSTKGCAARKSRGPANQLLPAQFSHVHGEGAFPTHANQLWWEICVVPRWVVSVCLKKVAPLPPIFYNCCRVLALSTLNFFCSFEIVVDQWCDK